MNIGDRLTKIADLVPNGSKLADIGTDHAYLPVYLAMENKIAGAIAGDIAAGPCQAARTTIAMYGQSKLIEVRQGSGLKVLKPKEADVISIAGMGAGTMIEILEADITLAQDALLILQPMTGADNMRKWLAEHGWLLLQEELVEENQHLYEIIVAEFVNQPQRVAAKTRLMMGPKLLENKHPLLEAQYHKQKDYCLKLLKAMDNSERAKASAKYQELKTMVEELDELARVFIYS